LDKVRISLRCNGRNECLELAEYIMNYRGVKAKSLIYEVSEGLVIIEVSGPKMEVVTTKRIIMKAYKEWMKIKAWSKGAGSIEIQTLMKFVEKPFVSDALVEVLKHLGYRAELKGAVLTSNAPPNIVINIAKALSQKLEELIRYKPRASATAKALITAYAYLMSLNARNALKVLEESGALRINGHRVLVTKEWRSLLRRLISSSRESYGARGKKENR